jgi:hypothetical protein
MSSVSHFFQNIPQQEFCNLKIDEHAEYCKKNEAIDRKMCAVVPILLS